MAATSTSFCAISGCASAGHRIAPSQRSGLQRGQDEVARELLARIETCARTAPRGQRAVAHLLELAALPEVERERDDLGAVLLDASHGNRRRARRALPE